MSRQTHCATCACPAPSTLREYRGRVSLREMAARIGISNAYLSQLESGKIKDPGYFMLLKIANYYQVDLATLAGMLGVPKVKHP